MNNSQQPESSVEPGGINLNNSQKPETSEDDEKDKGHQPEIKDGGIGHQPNNSRLKNTSKGRGSVSVKEGSRLRRAGRTQQYEMDKNKFFEWRETRYFNNPAHPNATDGFHATSP